MTSQTSADRTAVDTTVELLERARSGDAAAFDRLFERHLAPLRRWASGRLPRWARDIADTNDIVQDTVLHTFKRLDGFEVRGDDALQAYLRQAVVNRVRNELRRAAGHPPANPLDSGMPDDGTSPLETAIGQELQDQYEAALDRLDPEEREAIVSRVNFGLSYAELATVLRRPSPDAARMLVARSLVKLAKEMNR
jgi:RNA polymerase sigma-70 factor (ECF subfamily)